MSSGWLPWSFRTLWYRSVVGALGVAGVVDVVPVLVATGVAVVVPAVSVLVAVGVAVVVAVVAVCDVLDPPGYGSAMFLHSGIATKSAEKIIL